MRAIVTNVSLLLMCLLFSTALLTNAIELYSETDQLAEESFGGLEEEGHEGESTTTSRPNNSVDESGDGDKSSAEDEANDPLQKILPKVKFNCKGKSEGYYADNEFCELFHYCKTNGFRFTFMCPPDSYYNDKLMACEFNKTLSTCVHNRTKSDGTQDIGQNGRKEALIRTSAGETVEVVAKSSDSKTTTEKVESTTRLPNKAEADPYLTKWKAIQRTSTKRPENNNYIKARNSSSDVDRQTTTTSTENSVDLMGKDVEKKVAISETNVTQVILPFRGFRRHMNRTKLERNPKNNAQINLNQTQTVHSNTRNAIPGKSSTDSSVKVPPNVWPVLNSLRQSTVNNINQNSNQRTRSRAQTTTSAPMTTTTTTPLPSLMTPTTRGPTTVSPFDNYFTPIFNSDTGFNLNSDFFPLSLHRRPEATQNDKLKTATPISPKMTQNFFNTIHHMPRVTPSNSNKNSQIRQIPTETKQNAQFTSFFPSVMTRYQLPGHEFKRAPLFEDQIQLNYSNPIHETPILGEDVSMSEIYQNFGAMDANFDSDSQESEISDVETSVDENEPIEEVVDDVKIERKGKRGKRRSRPKRVLTVPLLVPTGVSKRELRRKLSETLLKPTVIPSPLNGQRMPAYILQFEASEQLKKHKKHRSKRQAFQWNNPFVSREYNNYYLPMNSIGSPVYSHFDNFVSNAFPLNSHNRQFVEIGERPVRMSPMAQNNMPYFSPPRQPTVAPNLFGPNFYRDNNMYDLSEFSDFYDNPFNKRPPMLSNEVPYRSVSLKRPSFRRPPRRQRIPGMTDRNITKKMQIRTTIRPYNSMPVSPRPYSQPLPTPKQQSVPTIESNPFTDFSDDGISEAIKMFDSSDDNLQPLDFESVPLLPFETPRSFATDFMPITPKARSIGSTLNERSSRISTFTQPPINSFDNSFISNGLSNFPPIPKFGDPQYRLPFVDIPDSTLTNYKDNQNNENKETNNSKPSNGTRYPTPYTPEVVYDKGSEVNTTERNPNHNYDNVELKAGETQRSSEESKPKFSPLMASPLNWDNIVGQYHKHNISKNSENKVEENKIEGNKNSTDNGYVSYGTRLSSSSVNKYSQSRSPQITVKASVNSVSSLQTEASNQVVVSSKIAVDLDSSATNVKHVNEIDKNDIDKNKNVDGLYNPRAFDRIMLFNYYNYINAHKPKNSMTSTVSPVENKYPSTAAWSIRDWTGQYYTTSTTTTTTTAAPVITMKSANIEPLDLFGSEAISSELTTESVPRPEPPYKKVFNSHMGATLHSLHASNKFHKPSIAESSAKTRSEISNFLSSLTSSTIRTV